MEIDARKEAIKLFNETWDLIDIPQAERSAEQNADMLHKAHTSRYLWGLVGEPVNLARGEWQVSHAYAAQGLGQSSLLHGQLSLDTVLKENISGMDLAFGYEAVARAYSILSEGEKARENKLKGLEAAALVEDEADRNYVTGELDNIPALIVQ